MPHKVNYEPLQLLLPTAGTIDPLEICTSGWRIFLRGGAPVSCKYFTLPIIQCGLTKGLVLSEVTALLFCTKQTFAS